MTSPLASDAAPFGRVLTAMVTPFTRDGELDLDAAQRVATHLVDVGNDGIVVSGTTGESPTTTNDEDGRLLAAVLEAVSDRASVVAGVGTNDTRHSRELAEQAHRLGAHGMLLVNPYYSKPPQAGIQAHIREVTRAGGGTPVMLYDIPGRTGVQLAPETLIAADALDEVVAIKDATGDLARGAWILNHTSLAIYSGDDAVNLPWLSIGAVGVVSVVGHTAGGLYRDMVRALDAGDLATAQELNRRLEPLVTAIMTHTQGAISSKVALTLLGVLEHATVRLPLSEPDDSIIDIVRNGLATAGLLP